MTVRTAPEGEKEPIPETAQIGESGVEAVIGEREDAVNLQGNRWRHGQVPSIHSGRA